MVKYKLKIEYETDIEGENEEDAIEKWWDLLSYKNETAETFITDCMEIIEDNETK